MLLKRGLSRRYQEFCKNMVDLEQLDQGHEEFKGVGKLQERQVLQMLVWPSPGVGFSCSELAKGEGQGRLHRLVSAA